MAEAKINLLIADDHEIVHDGIRLLLRKHPQFNILATALNGQLALEVLENKAIDILITDISMPQMDGIELTKKVKQQFPQVKVLVLTVHHDDETVRAILSSEAEGYILKNTGTKELVTALNKIANGDTCYSNEILRLLVKGFTLDRTKKPVKTLSQRELEVLQLVVDELTTQAIAQQLFISPKTVDTHRKNILKKTGVKTIVGLIKYAIANDLVDLK
ncbi:MAG: response regulator transcription factor [Bacteroidota bacterium]